MRSLPLRLRPLLAAAAISTSLLGYVQSAPAITLSDSQRARIDAVFAQHDNPNTPGCALGIFSDGQAIYSPGYGMARLSPSEPIDSSKLFDIASMSKQFTAASVVLLAQQGRLKLTDDVRKYVPELPSYGATITINHLLWHTSGLRDYTVLLLLGGHAYESITTKEQALQFVTRQQRLNFTPGTRYEYSNTGYFLLATIVERVTGQTLDQFARAQMFAPLGMPNAVFRDRWDKPIPNQALGYAPVSPGAHVISMSNWEQVGDGALQLSIDEALPWDENYYTGRLGGPAFLTEMHRTGRLSDGRRLIYARGLQVDSYRGLRRVRHGGDWIGYHGNWTRFPDQHTSVVLFCNSDGVDQYALSDAVVDIALENVFTQPAPMPPQPAPSLPPERFVGTYFDAVRDQVLSVEILDGQLVLNYIYLPLPLVSTGPTSFTIDGLSGSVVEFSVNGDAPAHALSVELYADEPDDLPWQAARFAPVTPPADLGQYAGTYTSAELGVSWTFAVTDGVLALQEDPQQIIIPLNGSLAPANLPDTFYGPAGYVQFTRDASGQVNGTKVSFIGMQDFRFVRSAASQAGAAVAGTAERPASAVPPAAARRLLIRK